MSKALTGSKVPVIHRLPVVEDRVPRFVQRHLARAHKALQLHFKPVLSLGTVLAIPRLQLQVRQTAWMAA